MHYLPLLLLCLGLGALQALIGGARLVYALPCYAVIALGALATIPFRPAPESRAPNLWCLGSAVALAGYLAGRAALSPLEYLARPDFLLILAGLLVYLLISLHFTSAHSRFAIVAALLGFAFFHIVSGAVQFRSGDDYMMLPWIVRPEQYFSRASGFFIAPSHLAASLEILAALSLGIAFWTSSRFATYLLAIYGVAVCLVGIAISGTPEATFATLLSVAAIAGMSVWTVRVLYRRRLILAVAAAVGTVALLSASALNFLKGEERFTTSAGTGASRTDFRPALRSIALGMQRENAVVGAGAGTFLVHARLHRPPEIQGEAEHAHSEYVELLAEYGSVGAGLAVLFLGTHLVVGVGGFLRLVRERARSTKSKRSRELALAIGGLGAATALLAHATTDFSLHIPAITLLGAVVFGILANPGRSSQRREPAGPSPLASWWWRWPAPALGLALLVLTVPRLSGEIHGERARLALRDQQYARAKDSARAALASESRNPNLHYYLGEASHYLGLQQTDSDTRFRQYTEAAQAFTDGLKLFPNDTRLLLKLGRTLDNLGRFDAARPHFERALEADPNFGHAYACFAVHQQMRGDVETARVLYEKARALGESAISTAGLADLEKIRERPFQRPTRPDILADFLTLPEVVAEPDAKPAP